MIDMATFDDCKCRDQNFRKLNSLGCWSWRFQSGFGRRNSIHFVEHTFSTGTKDYFHSSLVELPLLVEGPATHPCLVWDHVEATRINPMVPPYPRVRCCSCRHPPCCLTKFSVDNCEEISPLHLVLPYNYEYTCIIQKHPHGFIDPSGRSGKTNGIVIEAKMRAGRRQKLFRQETGWRKPNYAGVSVFRWHLQRHLLKKKEICWRQKFAYRICWQKEYLLTTKNLLTESADKNKICLQETSSYKICLRKERHLAMKKSWNTCLKSIW